MAPFLHQRVKRIIVVMLFLFCLADTGMSSKRSKLKVAIEEDNIEEPCLPCEVLFSKLERTGVDGKLSQDVRVQERGEPKSGTGVSYFWAAAALTHACDYLQELFGQGSCRIESTAGQGLGIEVHNMLGLNHMIFEPSLSSDESRCSCDTIDRVSITINAFHKHRLPVNSTCAFSHGNAIVIGNDKSDGSPSEPPCKFADGTHVTNHDELWRCMHEADCEVTDDWLQMAVFRDPRSAIVSTFYHIKNGKKHNMPVGDVDAFVVRELPIMCQWLALRYILFIGTLRDQSMEFWYEDAMADPLAWHYEWFYSLGLQLPFRVVEATARAAVADDIDFTHKGIERHPGEKSSRVEGIRLFENEVSSETLALVDSVLRVWLPPVLLERFGVVP